MPQNTQAEMCRSAAEALAAKAQVAAASMVVESLRKEVQAGEQAVRKTRDAWKMAVDGLKKAETQRLQRSIEIERSALKSLNL